MSRREVIPGDFIISSGTFRADDRPIRSYPASTPGLILCFSTLTPRLRVYRASMM